jgi:outer membrane murein-binding lipoprotein Lpp
MQAWVISPQCKFHVEADLLWQEQLKTLENDGLKQELQTLREEIKQISSDVKAGHGGAASATASSGAAAAGKSSGDYRGKIDQMSSEVRDDNPYRRYSFFPWNKRKIYEHTDGNDFCKKLKRQTFFFFGDAV